MRPTFGPLRMGCALETASLASLTTSLGRPVDPVAVPDSVAVEPPKVPVDVCCVCLGMLRRKFSNAIRLEALRKIL